jgi:hypothetical protein
MTLEGNVSGAGWLPKLDEKIEIKRPRSSVVSVWKITSFGADVRTGQMGMELVLVNTYKKRGRR